MSIQTLNGGRGLIDGIRWPDGLWNTTGYSLSQVSASTHQRAFRFTAPKAGNLSKFHFKTGNVATGDDLKISFQDANSEGKPDGVIDQYRVLTVDSADDNVWKTSGIISSDGTDGGAKRAVSAGDSICVVLEWNSYVAGSLWYQYLATASISGGSTFWQSTDSGSSWSEILGQMGCAVEYDDGTFAYIQNSAPIETFTSPSVGSGSTPDEYSLRFRLPFPARVHGIAVKSASQDTVLSLYPDSGAALASGSPIVLSTSGNVKRTVMFASPVDIDANVYYRIGWKPSTTTARSIPLFYLSNAAMREAFDLGLNFSLGTRTDSGSWSDDTAKFLLGTILVSGFDDGAGGGGGSCSYGSLPNGTRVIPVAQ